MRSKRSTSKARFEVTGAYKKKRVCIFDVLSRKRAQKKYDFSSIFFCFIRFHTKICAQTVPILGQYYSLLVVGGGTAIQDGRVPHQKRFQ